MSMAGFQQDYWKISYLDSLKVNKFLNDKSSENNSFLKKTEEKSHGQDVTQDGKKDTISEIKCLSQKKPIYGRIP